MGGTSRNDLVAPTHPFVPYVEKTAAPGSVLEHEKAIAGTAPGDGARQRECPAVGWIDVVQRGHLPGRRNTPVRFLRLGNKRQERNASN